MPKDIPDGVPQLEVDFATLTLFLEGIDLTGATRRKPYEALRQERSAPLVRAVMEWAAEVAPSIELASLVATARLHGVDELEYIVWLLRELARREWSPDAATCLLPDAWMASQNEETKESCSVEA